VTLTDGTATRLYELFHEGRFVLLTAAATGDVTGLPDDRVKAVSYGGGTRPGLPSAMLVRPDGYVAWASDQPDPAAAREAAIAWCGPR